MALPITFNNTTYPAGFLGTDDGAATNTFRVDDASTYSVTVSGTINKIGDTVTLTYGADAPAGFANTTITLTSTQYDNTGQILFTSTAIPPNNTTAQTYRYLLSNTQVFGSDTPAQRTRFTADPNDSNLNDYNVSAAPCFTTGTRIRVLRDGREADVAVEALEVGDMALTWDGHARRIEWIGHRSMDCRRHRAPNEIMPVRITAHAFGENRPARDLVVSPGHAVCLDIEQEILVPVFALLNGETIVQLDVDRVTYWHVELASHDILISENMPSESYLEMGNRHLFVESDTIALHATPDAPVASHDDFCRPFVLGGPQVEAIKARLALRALDMTAGPRARAAA